MPISQLPPTDLIQEKLLFSATPPAVAAAGVFALGVATVWLVGGVWLKLDWRKATPAVAVLALIAGMLVVPVLNAVKQQRLNDIKETRRARNERIESFESALNSREGGKPNGATQTLRKQELEQLNAEVKQLDAEKEATVKYAFEETYPLLPPDPYKWWHRGFALLLLAMAFEFVLCLPNFSAVYAQLIRVLVVVAVALGMTPNAWWAMHFPGVPVAWPPWALAGVIAVQWIVLDLVRRVNPGSIHAMAMAIVAGGLSTVAIHDDSARFTDYATFLLMGLTVIAGGGWVLRADVGSVAAVAVVPVIVTLAVVRDDVRLDDLTKPHVPTLAYWLVGFSPLLLGLFVIPPLTKLGTKWYGAVVKLLLVLIPVGIAVYLCMTEAPLSFEKESWE